MRSVLDPLGIDYEILVVDDDSRDGTEEIVSAIAQEDPRVRLLVRKGERGLSGAVLYGWRQTDAAILGVMDADLQHPPELLPALVAAILAGNDLAIGSRYTAGGELGAWNPVRSCSLPPRSGPPGRFSGRASAPTIPMTGFFLLRRECIDGIAFQPSGFKLLLEILVRGRIRSVEEVPLAFGSRAAGGKQSQLQSGLGLCQAAGPALCGEIRALAAILRLGSLQRRQQHPQQQKPAHAGKKHQRHANARLAVDLGHQVAWRRHREPRRRRCGNPYGSQPGTSPITSTPANVAAASATAE